MFRFSTQQEIKLISYNGSGFDCYNISNHLPRGGRVVVLNKNGKGIVSSKIFNWRTNFPTETGEVQVRALPNG